MRRGIRALALDFDGVIVDSMPLHESAWREAVTHVASENYEAVFEQIVRNLWSGFAGERMFLNTALTQDEIAAMRREKDRLWNVASSEVGIMPGFRDALERLSKRFPIYIATTAYRGYVEAVLTRESLGDYFEATITDDDVLHPKPATDLLEKIADDSQVELSKIFFIGDTQTDFEMASSAGSEFLLLDIHARVESRELGGPRAASWDGAMTFLLDES